MKIIFLDIDGVLNNIASLCYHVHIDPNLVRTLQDVVEQTEAKIVLSSSWRVFGQDNVEFMLSRLGLHAERLPPTPRLGGFRGDEVKAWLDQYQEYYGVTHYVIVDDGSDFLYDQKEYLVQTDSRHGLLRDHGHKMIELLNKE